MQVSDRMMDELDMPENQVQSVHHNFTGKQQTAYDCLCARGRTLYDQLRTQYGVSHGDAFGAALTRHGLSKVLWL